MNANLEEKEQECVERSTAATGIEGKGHAGQTERHPGEYVEEVTLHFVS